MKVLSGHDLGYDNVRGRVWKQVRDRAGDQVWGSETEAQLGTIDRVWSLFVDALWFGYQRYMNWASIKNAIGR